MRHRYFSPDQDRETAEQLAHSRRVDALWREYPRPVNRGSLGSFQAALEALHPDLVAGLPSGGMSLGAPDDPSLYPLCQSLIAAAPKALRDTLVLGAQPQSLDSALESARSGFGYKLKAIAGRAGFGRGHLLDVTLFCHEFQGADDLNAELAATALVRDLLGERLFNAWVRTVAVETGPRPGALRVVNNDDKTVNRFGLDELRQRVTSGVESAMAGLPESPCHSYCEHGEWTLFEIEPEMGAIAGAQSDLVLCSSMLPEKQKCFLEGAPFASERFSRHGETFCYIKIDPGPGSASDHFGEKEAWEEQLNRLLVPGRLGCVVGTGLGLRYIYIDLALQEVHSSVALIRKAMERIGFPEQAWLLFCDSSLAQEYICLGTSDVPPGWDEI